MTEQTRPPRLTGRHLVLVVVALCAAAVLTPVSVQAAGIAKFRLVDANSTRAVEVSRTGRLQSDVRGSVTVTGGQVGARYAAPPGAFSTFIADNRPLGDAVGTTRQLNLTSITIANLVLGEKTTVMLLKYDPTCTDWEGVYFRADVPANGTFTASFPTPLMIDADTCTRFNLPDASRANITVTGYVP